MKKTFSEFIMQNCRRILSYNICIGDQTFIKLKNDIDKFGNSR